MCRASSRSLFARVRIRALGPALWTSLVMACAGSSGPVESEGDAGGRETWPSAAGNANQFWPSGTDGLDPSFAGEFAQFRGRETSSAWVNLHWVAWDWLTEPGLLSSITGQDRVKVWSMFADWPGVLALSMAMAGMDEGVSQSEYDDNMRQCAKGAYDEDWRTFAANAAAAGRTGDDTVVSLAHEFNGTWFVWNPREVGVDTWLACWRHVYDAIKSASDLRVAWVFSATANTRKDGDFAIANAWDAYPGDDYVDVIGIDRYDFQALGSSESTDWRDTCGNSQDLCDTADYARTHGKALGVPEWSIERGKYGYGDNPNFVKMMYGFFRDNRDVLAFENNFNNGGEGDWHLYPTDANNAKASARYQELWRAPD